MISRPKRPLESHDDNPPDKRSRPPLRPTMQNRCAHSAYLSLLSLLAPRETSFAGTSNLQNSPSGPSDPNRKSKFSLDQDDENTRSIAVMTSGARAMSPISMGNGASNPSNHAALVPPRTGHAANGLPATMHSLRRLKDRKRLIAQQRKPAVAADGSVTVAHNLSRLEALLKAQQYEITQLKKQQQGTTDGIKKLEVQSRSTDLEQKMDIETRFQPTLDRLQPILERLPALLSLRSHIDSALSRLDTVEIATGIPDLQQDVNKLTPVLDRLAALERRASEPDNAKKQTAELRLLSDRVKELEAALHRVGLANNTVQQSSESEIAAVRKDIDSLKYTQGLQKIGLATLTAWKNTRPKGLDEDAVKKLVLDEVSKKTELTTGLQLHDIKAMETGLATRITQCETTNAEHATQTKALLEFKDLIEKQNLSTAFAALSEKLRSVESNADRTHNKITRLDTRIDDLGLDSLGADLEKVVLSIDKYVGPIKEAWQNTELSLVERLDKLAMTADQISQHKLKLTALSEAHEDSVKKMLTRVSELEQAVTASPTSSSSSGPVFKKPGTPMTASANVMSSDKLSTGNEQIDQLVQTVNEIRQKLTDRQSLESKLNTLEARINSLEQSGAALSEEVQSLEQTLGNKSSELEINGRLTSVSHNTAMSEQLSALQETTAQLETAMEEHDVRVHGLSTIVEAVQTGMVDLFKEQFDPFRSTTQETLKTIDSKINAHSEDIDKIKRRFPDSGTPLQSAYEDDQPVHYQSIANDGTQARADVKRLETSLSVEIAARNKDQQAITAQMDGLTYALNHLESRYENITTEELHKAMVHWFTQMYPSNASTMLKNYDRMQQVVAQLQSFNSQVSWLKNSSEDLLNLTNNSRALQELANSAPQLMHLVKIGPNLTGLINSAQHLQGLASKAQQLQALANNAQRLQALMTTPTVEHTTLVKIDQACSDAQIALAKVKDLGVRCNAQGDAIEKIQKEVSDLQNRLPSVTRQAIEASEIRIAKEQKERLDSINELRASLDGEHDKRIVAESQLRSSVDDLKQMNSTLEPRVSQIAEQVSQVQASSSQTRQELDTMNSAVIEPNREFFASFGVMVAVLAQLQEIVESLNQNLPVGPLKWEWEYYFPSLGSRHADNDSNKGKDKSKQ